MKNENDKQYECMNNDNLESNKGELLDRWK